MRKIITLLMTACLVITAFSSTAFAEYNDYEVITNTGINIASPQKLKLGKSNFNTTLSNYFITGSSNVNNALTMNGTEITGRGQQGSFGVYVALKNGANTFNFVNGNQSQTLTITRSKFGTAGKTSVITSAYPTYNDSVESGSEYILKCTAPAGAKVTASVNGQNISMKQVAAASTGVPAIFKGSFYPSNSGGTTSLGKVQYNLSYNGTSKTFTSAGELFVHNGNLVVEVVDEAVCVYTKENASNYLTTLRFGSTDLVLDESDDMYKLSMGGWLKRTSVSPKTGNPSYKTKVTSTSLDKNNEGEYIVLSSEGGKPVFTSSLKTGSLTIKLFNTTGINNISGSDIFSNITVATENGHTTLELTKKNTNSLWGYDIKYKNGNTVLYFKKPPSIASNGSLRGVVIALDPGHGGVDGGAGGPSYINGAIEKDLNRATAIATQKRLESLGATVIMTRSGDEYCSLNERLSIGRNSDVDFFISLHHNSIAEGVSGLKAKGTEVYYYEGLSKSFGDVVLNKLVNYTGRENRGVRHSNFRVTLNTYAPSLLLELGFLSNPVEYDNLCTKNSLFKTANAIGDAIIAYLS